MEVCSRLYIFLHRNTLANTKKCAALKVTGLAIPETT